jgi:hypothetical protein
MKREREKGKQKVGKIEKGRMNKERERGEGVKERKYKK